jgi:glutathione S-transferase
LNNFDLEQVLAAAFTEESEEQTGSPKLALYMTPICPYCIYVRSAINELGLDVEMRSIYEREHFNDLVAARNRPTVPVLRISYPDNSGNIEDGGDSKGDTWLPESRDIVEYLEQLQSQF